MNWDDLRIADAIHRAGSFAGAARQLGLDETTVARRLARVERVLDIRLFDTIDGQRRATAAGRRILDHVEEIGAHARKIAAEATAADGPVGTVRIAATSAVASSMLAPRAPAFLDRNPGLSLEFLTATAPARLERWEADLAIRLARPERGNFRLTRLAEVGFWLLRPKSGPAPLVCAYPDDLAATPEMQALDALGLTGKARMIASDGHVIRAALATGHAAGILPDYLMENLPGDDILDRTRLEIRREVWLLIQPHLAADVAVRRVIDWLQLCFADAAEAMAQPPGA